MLEPRLSAVVVIPTRNRSNLAQTAAQSVLAETGYSLSVVISDNSTEPDQTAALKQFCESLGDSRLYYIRPPTELPMTDHWEWVMEQVLARFSGCHVTYLTDRTVFKPGGLREILNVAQLYPNHVISCTTDIVDDETIPARVMQEPWTGKTFLLSSEFILWQNSRCEFRYYMPRMLNCVVPPTVMQDLKHRFGRYFASIAPDHNFCYRLLYMVDNIVYYDKTVHINYARNRSNGVSQQRGIPNKDNQDFNHNISSGKLLLDLAPIPEITGTGNFNIYEYRYVQIETGSPKLPPIDMRKYLQCMAFEMESVTNPATRAEWEKLLRKHGWSPTEVQTNSIENQQQRRIGIRSSFRVRMAVRRAIDEIINRTPSALLVPVFRLFPKLLSAGRWQFRTSARALEWAAAFERPRINQNPYLEDSDSVVEFVRQCPDSVKVIPGPALSRR